MTEPKEADVWSQIVLPAEGSCKQFTPHKLKPNYCVECNKLMASHTRAAIGSAEALLRGMEYSQDGEKVPSRVVEPAGELGPVFLGGYKAVMNSAFLKEHNVRAVLCTASGLGMFGPRYLSAIKQATASGIKFMDLDWIDHPTQSIAGDVVRAVEFVHEQRNKGGVLVHCAQGKSRSATCVVAYLMATQEGLSADAALEQVRRARRMAEPNEGFMKQLRLLGSSSEHKGWADACRAMRTSGSSAAASTAAAEGAAGSGDGDVAAASSEAKSDAAGKAGDGGSETAAISAGS